MAQNRVFTPGPPKNADFGGFRGRFWGSKNSQKPPKTGKKQGEPLKNPKNRILAKKQVDLIGKNRVFSKFR
jgi:hypothetical protein